MRVRLAEFDNVVEAENAMLALEAGGIEAFDSVQSGGIPGLGQTSLLEVFVIEVEEADLARAEQLIRPALETVSVPAPVEETEKPVELRESLVASYRRASTIMLVGGIVVVALAAAMGRATVQLFGAIIWDFLIWRMLHDSSVPAKDILRARRFGQFRIVATTVAILVGGDLASPVTWVLGALIAFCFVLYLPSPEPVAVEPAKAAE